jgi:transcriptional regulator with XRE-family HTH domain
MSLPETNVLTGTQLLQARLAKQLTQEKLATEIGYTARQIRAWEKGAVVIPASACRSLARVLA